MNSFGHPQGRVRYFFNDQNGKKFNAQYFANGIAGDQISGTGNLTLDLMINTYYMSQFDEESGSGSGFNQLTITLGHEAFIHSTQSIAELIEAIQSGDVEKIVNAFSKTRSKNDHINYLTGQGDFSEFETYLKELGVKTRLIQQHDDFLKEQEGMK